LPLEGGVWLSSRATLKGRRSNKGIIPRQILYTNCMRAADRQAGLSAILGVAADA